MLLITCVCSDPACAEEQDVIAQGMQMLEPSSCDCGYGLVLFEVAEVELV